ncbi:hypothetical protein Slin14017_G117440 [Septoria linicola]|nr:hypothetical protein Slin14017_G117440 [Septoria linicola]
MCKECLAKALEAQFNITKPEHICCPVATCRQVWSVATVLKCLGKDSEGRRRQHEYNGLRAYRQMQERVAGSKGLQHIDRRAKELSYNSVVIVP